MSTSHDPSPSSIPEQAITLSVYPADGEAVEVAVYDGQLQMRARATGWLETALPPGIYKVKAIGGGKSWEKLAVLQPGSSFIEIHVPPLIFASPVPLPDTSQSHEYHQAAAYRASRPENAASFSAGQGSSIFVMGRRFTPPGQLVPPDHCGRQHDRDRVHLVHIPCNLGFSDMWCCIADSGLIVC